MPELSFEVLGAAAVPFAASPQLAIELQIRNRPDDETVHAVLLQCQLRIEPALRAYSPVERAGLGDLFGLPDRWRTTLTSLLWTHVSAQVPTFTGHTRVQLHVPCTFDFDAAVTQYCHALGDGEVPLRVLFSGTIFYAAADGALQASRVPWSKEVSWRMPLHVWKDVMDHHYPGRAVLSLSRDLVDRLRAYKSARGLPTLDAALDALLPGEHGDRP